MKETVLLYNFNDKDRLIESQAGASAFRIPGKDGWAGKTTESRLGLSPG